MAHRSQCSSAGDNPLDPNYLPPHYREEYRLAIDALVEEDLEGYYQFLQKADVVDFLSPHEIQYIQESVQIPQQIRHSEQNFLETVGDGSSDTYWPIHSDLDAPGLDLGWPDLHAFIGPTEVTTLVNPPEPEMPSIKEQARRLIKNAQQVIAIAMDMFTDVDIFHDIVHAAMRNVAVYILLDELNVQHFINMVNNCRVNLQSIQLIRVRTVNGITYHCRSGKSFKGQMMNRFLLTDCRAVLSGNYSFMWSFEKLHRSMAHLFLGQLVSTFDEEFRILYAQSQPLLIEDMFAPMKEFNILEKRKYPSERTSLLSESRKFLSLDTPHPDELPRHSYDEHVDMDWRMMAIKKKEPLHGSADMYGRFPSPKQRMDPSFDQGPPRMPMMDNPSLKRYSYAEGVQSRHTYPFMPQQGMPEADNQGRQFHRQQQPYPGPGREPDYSPYDKFWNQDYLIADPYPEPGLPQEVEPPDNFDPVFSYLSSTRNLDFDQSSDKLPAAPDLPLSSSFPRRLSLGQPYACQTSPTPSNASEQKQFFQEPNPDRKDPIVKRGLRDWRISSYLSAYDSRGDEGPPLAPLNMPDPNEPSNPIQQPTPEVSVSKIPNVREFRIPAIPRASQMPIYAKILPREQPKNMFEEPITVATPSPSESSSTTEGEKTEEMEQKEPKPSVFQREDSFRRKFNPGVLRSSRLRSSLIFSSLDQQQDARTNPGQQEEDSDKNEAEQTKPSFVSQVLGQRRSTPREPFEWSRFIKQAADTPAEDASKPDDGSIKADDKDAAKDENSRDSSGKREVLESSKQPDVEQTNSSSSVLQSKPTESEPTQTDQPMKQPKPLPTSSMYLDMSDPDARLMFFKELAAKRKAAKAAEAEKGKVKEQMKTPTEEKNNTAVKKEQAGPQETAASMSDSKTSVGLLEKNTTAEKEKTVPAETCKTVSLSSGTSEKNYQDSHGESDPNTNQSSKEAQTRISTDKELNIEMKTSQPAASVPVSGKGEAPRSKLLGEPKLSEPKLLEPAAEIIPPSIMDATPANAPAPAQGTDEAGTPCIGSTSNESSLLAPTSVEVPPCSSAALESKAPNLEASISHPPLPSEQHTGSEPSSSNSVLTPPSDHILPDSSSKTSPGSSPSISSPFPTKADLISSDVTTEHPSPNQQETSALSTQSSSSATLDFNTKNPESVQSARGISCPPLPPEQDTGSKPNSSNPTVQIHPSDPPVSGSPIRPGSSPSTSSPPSTKAGTVSSDFSPEDSSSNQLPPNQQESVTASTPSSKEALEQTKAEDESNQGHIDSVSQLTSSETVSGVVPAHVESDISPDKCAAAASEPITSSTQSTAKTDLEATCGPTHSEDPKSERATGEESEVLESSGRGRADDSSPESCLHNAVDPERISRTDQNEITVSTFSAADFPSEHSPAETNCLFHPEVTTPASGLETITSPKDPPVTPSSVGIESCSPLTESAGSVLTQRLSASQSPSDTQLPQEQVTDSNTPPDLPLTEICSPKEPTSTALTEPESVTPERVPPEPPAPAEDSTMVRQNKENQEIEVSDPGEKIDEDTQATLEVDKTKESASSEKINDQIKQGNCSDPPEITSDEVIPTSPLTKQPKSSQCRYHSSTANVLSSSNLRDDTKLLLEQISANSQSRNDATKEAPVTDDEKEDEADKNAQREKERGMRYLSKVPEKSNQERDKLLERIQSMRKERKVYSRFEKSTSFSRREKASLISAKPASVERELLPPPRHNSTPDGALTRI